MRKPPVMLLCSTSTETVSLVKSTLAEEDLLVTDCGNSVDIEGCIIENIPDIIVVDYGVCAEESSSFFNSIKKKKEDCDSYLIVMYEGYLVPELRVLYSIGADDVCTMESISKTFAFRIEKLLSARKELGVLRGSLIDMDAAQHEESGLFNLLAHDLRGSLSIINGYIGQIGMGTVSPDDIRNTCQRRVRHMLEYIEEVLDLVSAFSGKKNFDLSPLDARELIRDEVDALAHVWREKGCNVVTFTGDYPVMCLCDRNKSLRVLGNLLDNAIRHSPEGETITVGLDTDNDKAVISVSDNGDGLSAEQLDNVFSISARHPCLSRQDIPRVGLGLAISRKFVEMMGGAVFAKSDGPGKGATFSFSLPLAEGS